MWQRITVEQYQLINKIHQDKKADDVEKTSRVIGVIYRLTEKQIDALPLATFKMYMAQAATLTELPKTFKVPKRIGIRRMMFNPEDLRFAQFMEVQHFLSDMIGNLHLIAASISRPLIGKNKSEHHKKVSESFTGSNFIKVFGAVSYFCEQLKAFNKKFRLSDEEESEEDEENPRPSREDPFIKNYGWLYAATTVRDHEGIPLYKVYDMLVLEVLSAIDYLKNYEVYQKALNKKRERA